MLRSSAAFAHGRFPWSLKRLERTSWFRLDMVQDLLTRSNATCRSPVPVRPAGEDARKTLSSIGETIPILPIETADESALAC